MKKRKNRGNTGRGETVTSFPATLMQFCIPQAHKKKKTQKVHSLCPKGKKQDQRVYRLLQRFHALQR